MNEIGFRTARTTVIAAVFFVMLMLGVPSYFAPGQQLTTTTNAAAVDVQRDFIIGVSELSVSTLNPNTYTMVGEAMLIFPCYSTLIQYDKSMDNLIGDVAEEWSCSPDGLTWHFKLVENAYFCDPAAPTDTSHQLTASDVEFSFMGLQNEDGSRLHTYFPDIIESFTILNDFEFEITLNGPFATIMESWMGAMILPEYYWAGEDFLNFDNSPPIGSGAFYYATDGLPEAGTAELTRNPTWYGTENHGWQMHCDRWIIKEVLSDDAAWTEVKAGTIDVMMGVNPGMYVANLQAPSSTPNVVGFSQGNGFVYEFNLNQMSDALREELGGQFLSGENNQILLDEDVKMAMSLSVDKYGFIDDVLYGLGSYADSLVTPQNPGHYWYPDPDPYDPEMARQTLWDAGWQYYMNGTHITYGSADYYTYYPLCKVGGTDPLQFEFVTLSNDVLWTVAAKYIVNTTRLGGFDLQLSIESTNDMNSMWYQADYDVWLWDWVIGVTADPVNTMEIFWSGAIGTDQDVYWVNDTFDEIYYEAQVTMDPVARRDLTDQLQSMAYEMRGCQCVAYREELYAVYIGEWAQESLGDWENDYYMLPDIWPWWLSMSIYPNENNAPDLYSYPTEVEAEVDVAEIFTANANDDDSGTTLEYRWFWGNGEKSDWSTSTSASYTYLEDGIYMADVAVREKDSSMGFEDYFMVSKQFKVTVRDLSNEAPSISAWSCEPAAPDTGTDMWFNATAVDPEGDDIYYVWTFGDGHSEYSQNVRHQFTEDDSYTVTLSIDDQHIGAEGSRPVTASALVAVARNHEPTVSVPDVAGIYSKETNTFTVTSDDADPLDELLYTWFWGDGGVSVTTEPTAEYMYNSKGTFTMTVYADDQTGLDGHNATDTGLVSVLSRTTNKVPVPSALSVTDATPYTGQIVTFSGSATDRDGDALTLTIEFGDGTFAVVNYPVSADNLVRTISSTKSYAAAGTYTAYLYAFDQVANVSSGPLSIVVEANDAPIFDEPLEAELGDTGEPMSFSAGVYDPDGDTMSYYWTWGDGTADVTVGPTATHTYDESGTYQYRLYVDDGFSHNETSYNTADVNAVPSLTALPTRTIDAGVVITFTADALDPDLTDVLTFEWDFGDLSPTEPGVTVTHTYSVTGDYTYSVTVTDGFALSTHTLYDEATVTVSDPAVDDPPVVTPLEDIEGTVNEVLTFSVIASDPEDMTLTITWDFGDGSDLVVGNDVEHAYATAMTYTFHVWVDDGFTNVTDSADAVISADLPPIADAGEDQTVNEDTTMQFDGSDSDDDVLVMYYDWTIYDSLDAVVDTLVGVDPVYEFAEPGEYTVELVVEDTIGQLSAVDTMTVTVEDITAPEAIALADPMVVDMGGTIDFDASTSSDNYDEDLTYAWSFSDGVSVVTETAETFSHVFTVAGAYPVTLNVTDDAGNFGTDVITVTVNDIEDPVANAGTDAAVNIAATHMLNGSLSTDNEDIVSWTWTFTDVTAQTLSGQFANYTFDNGGVFVITLTVEDAAGNTATDTVTITVSDIEAPEANVADIEIYEGEMAEFDSALCSDNVAIVDWEWTFVYDGVTETLTLAVDSFLFEIPGDYDVTLTVSDAAGNTAAVIFVVSVLDDEDPVADAGADIADAVVGTAVEFDGTLSSDTEGAIANWTWSIDSVEVAWGETASYTFDEAGTYTVTLTVTDSYDQTATDELAVTVTEASGLSDPPLANAGPDETIEVGDEYTFDGSDSSDDVTVVNWTWEFEYDGETVTLYGESPAFTFELVDDYLVTLTVTDADGQTDTDMVTITVEEPEVEPEDEPSFIEQYGLAIGAVLAIAAIAAIAMLLMKKRKGGKSSSDIDGVSSESEPPSQ